MRKKEKNNSVHVVFGAECTKSMDWKSIAVFHTFRTSGWVGNITRLLACSPEQKLNYLGMDIGPTFVHPNYHFVEGYEDSPTYNKPAALMHFTKEVEIEEEYLLYIDADMLLRRVVDPEIYGAKRGHVVTEYVWYVRQGILNGLADQFLPDDKAKNNAKNTHGGYYHLIHKDDAKAVTPLWLHYTREMRLHPERYWAGLEGSKIEKDIDTVQRGVTHGHAPWISEMYGYAFAAAHLGLTHSFTRGGGGVLYGDDFMTLNHAGPFAAHYTLSCSIPSKEHYFPFERDEDSYKFDKNEYTIDVINCDKGGWLDEPPRSPVVDEAGALCLENVERINYALCDYYRQNCPSDSYAYLRSFDECPYNVNEPYSFHYHKVKPAPCGDRSDAEWCHSRIHKDDACRISPPDMTLQCLKSCDFCMPKSIVCEDRIEIEKCNQYAQENECVLNPTFMTFNCRKTCNACEPNSKPTVFLPSLSNEDVIDTHPMYTALDVAMTSFKMFLCITLLGCYTFMRRKYTVFGKKIQ